ncbi:hypothetical protein DPMN_102868 [Dreissena polymorpha]|uniref:Uncharacterized protein n=1 Tax=Dreissena polymorpha TaxID=45954 RepID=A0A9D4JZK4_DREPO|nr:hypothetical protein DPMN_102868 [Dreissena polymorpha]
MSIKTPLTAEGFPLPGTTSASPTTNVSRCSGSVMPMTGIEDNKVTVTFSRI